MKNESWSPPAQDIQLWHILLMFAIVAIGIGFIYAPGIRKATYVDPANFTTANRIFLDGLPTHVIALYDNTSLATKLTEKHEPWTIEVRPIGLSSRGKMDRDSMRRLLNEMALIFACKELSKGDKSLGLRLLELLQKHDPELYYCYPITDGTKILSVREKVKDASITMPEFLRAGAKMAAGDDSERWMIEKPASQWEFRAGECK